MKRRGIIARSEVATKYKLLSRINTQMPSMALHIAIRAAMPASVPASPRIVVVSAVSSKTASKKANRDMDRDSELRTLSYSAICGVSARVRVIKIPNTL